MKYNEFVELINNEKDITESFYEDLINQFGKDIINSYFEKYIDEITFINDVDKLSKVTYYIENVQNLYGDYQADSYDDEVNCDILKMYLKEISLFPLLNKDQEYEMAVQIDEKRKFLKEKNISSDTIDILLEKFGIEYKNISFKDKIFNVKNKIIELKNKKDIETLKKLVKLVKIMEYYSSYLELSNKFISYNLRLVISIAKIFIGRGVDFLDLIQEGNIGLEKAFNRFDVNKGYKFSTYATWCIRREVVNAVQSQCRVIKFPSNVYELYYKICVAQKTLERVLSRNPKDDEILNYFREMSINKLMESGIKKPTESQIKKNMLVNETILNDIRELYQPVISLHSYMDEDEEEFKIDYLADSKNNIEKYLEIEGIRQLLSILTLREKVVVILHYSLKLNDYMNFEEFCNAMQESRIVLKLEEFEKIYYYLSKNIKRYTLAEIGKLFNITSESIRLNELNAIRKLKRFTKNEKQAFLNY